MAESLVVLKVDLSAVAAAPIGLKTVKVPVDMTVSDMLRKLLQAPAVRKILKGAENYQQLTMRVKTTDKWLDDTDTVQKAKITRDDVLEVRHKNTIPLVVQLTLGAEQTVVLDKTVPVKELLPGLCQRFGLPPEGMGLRIKSRDEFLQTSLSLEDQLVRPGITLILQVRQCFGVRIEELTTPDTVPVIMRKCTAFVEEKALDVEGIYRESGLQSHLEVFKEVFNKGEIPNFGLYSADPHVVAGLIKLFLREMPEPCITFALYDKFLEVARSDKSQKACMKRYQALVGKLPEVNRTLLLFLLQHLRRVAEHSDKNRMPSSNIAAVMGPNILRPEQASMLTTIRDTAVVNSVMKIFIDEMPYLFLGEEKEYSTVSLAKQKREAQQQQQLQTSPTMTQAQPEQLTSEPQHVSEDSNAVEQEVVALYDYQDEEEGHLQFHEGDALYIVRHVDDNWLEARNTAGAQGLIPASYVELKECPQPATQTRQSAALVLARILYDYKASEDNELNLMAGNIVNVLDKSSKDWWLGTDGVHTGLFPAEYVQLLPAQGESQAEPAGGVPKQEPPVEHAETEALDLDVEETQ